MNTITPLEQAAIAAFHAGHRWHEYVQENKNAIREAERRHPGTVDKLLALLTSGNTNGMEPPPPAFSEQTLFDVSEPHMG